MTKHELQCRILYAAIVAGKSAKFTEKVFMKLFPKSPIKAEHENVGTLEVDGQLPFTQVKRWITAGTLRKRLEEARSGNYTKLERTFTELVNANLDLETCTPEDLEKIHGINPKTSRFFVLWTRPDARCAVLDVHVLRWMRKQGIDTPKQTPSGPKYAKLEKLFLDIVDRLGLTPRQVDEQVWMKGSGYGQYNPAL